MPKAGWSHDELQILAEDFCQHGPTWCASRLPGRTANAVEAKARKLGMIGRRSGYVPMETSEYIDAAIKRAYQGERKWGFVARLSQSVQRPVWWVSNRAVELGFAPSRKADRPWSEAETEFADAHPLTTPKYLAELMRQRGWIRTASAIAARRQDEKIGRTDTGWFTATGLAAAMGVDAAVVVKWIRNGWLLTDRRGWHRSAAQGGDGYAIHESAVARFVVEHASQVCLSKIEPNKVWFIDLMARCAAPSTGTERDLGKRIVALAEARPDLSYTQIADMLGSQPGSVKVILSKARRARCEANAA